MSTTSELRMTQEFSEALSSLHDPNGHVFLYGNAGTGKSTLLNLFREQSSGVVVVAPTGVAAVNVSGQTIHSFFMLPLGIVDSRRIKTSKKRTEVLKHAAAVVIDEVSMVRADVMDAIDLSLRLHMGNDAPFGGKKVIMVGDVAQLPPVTRPEDEAILKDMGYESPFFFDSKVIRRLGADLKRVELKEIFRQTDREFVDILNRMRRDEVETADLVTLNKRRMVPPQNGKSIISLTSTNKAADSINEKRLAELPGKLFKSRAEIIGDFDEKSYPAEKDMVLKVGAQVMLLRNDRAGRWVNGTVGIIEKCHKDKLTIKIGDDSHEVEKEKWDKVEYSYDSATQSVESDTIGSFIQFPVRLAWAITIHKCVSSETRIPTSHGLVKIGTFRDSMPELVSGVRESKAVSELFDSGDENGYKITTRKGYEIVCSERHPLLAVRDGAKMFVKAPDLIVGDFLRMRVGTNSEGDGVFNYKEKTKTQSRSHYKLPTKMSDDLAWFLGALVGDGCVSDKRDGRIDITCEDMEVIDAFGGVCKNVFGINYTVKKHHDRNAFLAYAHNKRVREFLEFIGLGYETAYDKKIPESVFTSPVSCQAAFLRGLFDTDGGASANEIHLTTTSEVLAKDVQILLANIGVCSSRRDQSRKLSNEHDQWRVGIMGRQSAIYLERVGFTIPRKTASAAALVERSSNNKTPKVDNGRIPGSQSLALKMREEIRSVLGCKYGTTRRLSFGKHWAKYLSRVVSGKSYLTDTHLRELYAEIPETISAGPTCNEWISEAIAGAFTDEIVSISREKAHMMDIHVPDGNAFVGNVFVNHNSQGKTYDNVIIDLGWGAFAHGQTYVALSRCRSLEGVYLKNHIKPKDIIVERRVIEFMAA
jgi:intein/homing endonuclease